MKTYPYFKSLVTCAGILVTGLFAASANAAPVFFSDRTTFDNEAGPLSGFEDFEEANLGMVDQPGPWDSTTDDAIFSPGEIVEGVAFDSTETSSLIALGPAFGLPSIAIGPFLSTGDLDIFFTPGVNAVGFDVFLDSSSPIVEMAIGVFDVDDLLIATEFIGMAPANPVGAFFGVIDTMASIGRIRLSAVDPVNVSKFVDNIAFGSLDAARVPTPGSLALLGLGMAGLGLARRGKKAV